jgi:carboxypeptidase T
MTKGIVFFILIFSFCALFTEQVVVRFDNPTNEIIKEFTTNDYDVASYKPGEYLDLVVHITDYNKLLDSGYEVRITQTEDQLIQNLRSDEDLAGYMDYEEFLAAMQQAEFDHPDLCKLYDIGDSWGKIYSDAGNSNYDDFQHEIWALKLSDNVEVEEDEPCIYYFAEHHAREPISLEVVMTVLNHILENYGTDPDITDNVNNQQIWFVPLVNPNGHKVVTDEVETMWRKNIRDNNENGSINVTGNNPSDGADPNRNYGWEWGGASTNWTSETYQGTAAFSEPETQAVQELMATHHFVAGLSYHSYSELILFPYGYSDDVVAPDQLALSELCTDMAVTIPGQYGGHYTPQAAWALYSCTGTTDDYAYGNYGIFSFTVELATEFIPPANQVDGICDNNIEAALIMLDRTSHSIILGHVTDSASGLPLQAEIFIDGIDNTGVYRNPYMSNQEYGSYYRLLTDGTYDVTFQAYGYGNQTFENVVITSDDQTILDVVLSNGSATASVSGVITDAETGFPIENAIVELIEYGIPAVSTNAQGEYTIFDIFEYTYNIVVYADGYAGIVNQIDISEQTTDLDFEIFVLDDGTFEDGMIGGCWNFGGQADWQIATSEVYEGVYSIQSGSIGHNAKSDLEVSLYVSNDDEISFYKKVSSESDYDYLKFFIDGELQNLWSGNDNWTLETYPVTSGMHTFLWSYVKDGGVASGSDCGWIDNIVFPTSAINVSPSILDFMSVEDCIEGKLFVITNTSDASVTLNDLTQTGSVFEWFIDDFTLELPYTMDASEELEFLVKVTLPTENITRDILTENLVINTDSGGKNVTINFDESINVGAEENPIVFDTKFYGNYPNPFNPSTTFKFSLSTNSHVELNIYNVKGQLVKTLINKEMQSGIHSIIWNGENNNKKPVTSGIYYSIMDTNTEGLDFTSIKKVILLK